MEGAYGQGRIVLSALALDGTARPRRSWRHCPGGSPATFADTSTASAGGRPGPCADAVIGPAGISGRGRGRWRCCPTRRCIRWSTPGLFTAQTAWLATQAQRMNIRYVVHLGDIVNNNTAFEWERAATAMSLLDGRLPYALVPGNHDYGPSGDASTRGTLLNEYFPLDRMKGWPSFGGAYQPRPAGQQLPPVLGGRARLHHPRAGVGPARRGGSCGPTRSCASTRAGWASW